MSDYQVITSTDNRIFKLLKSLSIPKRRREAGLFMAEGYKLIRELLEAGLVPEIMVYTEGFLADPAGQEISGSLLIGQQVVFSDTLFSKLAETVNPQGVIAAFRIPTTLLEQLWSCGPGGKPYVLCLDQVQDPGNLGTIIRTCSAFGYALVLSKGCVDLYNPKVVRSSMGEIAKVPILTDVDIVSFLRSAPDIPILVTAPHGGTSLLEADTSAGCILIVGNEANGVSAKVAKFVGRSFYIPMVGQAESLNAAVATAIAVFETVRPYLCSVLSPPNTL